MPLLVGMIINNITGAHWLRISGGVCRPNPTGALWWNEWDGDEGGDWRPGQERRKSFRENKIILFFLFLPIHRRGNLYMNQVLIWFPINLSLERSDCPWCALETWTLFYSSFVYVFRCSFFFCLFSILRFNYLSFSLSFVFECFCLSCLLYLLALLSFPSCSLALPLAAPPPPYWCCLHVEQLILASHAQSSYLAESVNWLATDM